MPVPTRSSSRGSRRAATAAISPTALTPTSSDCSRPCDWSQPASQLPMVAAGGIADGATVAAVLCAGASAAQIGTALMLTPEAGTPQPYREALATSAPTRLTRAFTGRPARGIVNRFLSEHGEHAPAAYPDVHQMTVSVRAAAREAGDPGAINLWAGQTHALAVSAAGGRGRAAPGRRGPRGIGAARAAAGASALTRARSTSGSATSAQTVVVAGAPICGPSATSRRAACAMCSESMPQSASNSAG